MKLWRPQLGNFCYYICIEEFIEIKKTHCINGCYDDQLYAIGNVFRTKREAQIIAEKFKKILTDRIKGE